MSDQSRILLAIGGLVLGLALSAGGTYLLGNARAVARYSGTDRRRRADVGQYVAAFGALLGFALVSGGAALIVSELMPASDAVKLVGGAVAGVLAFAAAGVSFSRVADASESARVQRMPAPAYVPAPPSSSPALPPGLTVPSAPPARPPALAPPALGLAAELVRPTPDAMSSPPPAEPTTYGTAWSASAELDAAPEGPPPSRDLDGAAIERALTAGTGADASDDTPIELEQVSNATELVGTVRPGWIYRDEEDGWYLGVGGGGSSGPLLRLPEFRRVSAGEPRYPLLIVGAGEIAVVPVPTDTAATVAPAPS